MSRRDAVDLAVLAVGLVALLARAVALALAEIDEGIRDFTSDIDTVPDWMNEEADL